MNVKLTIVPFLCFGLNRNISWNGNLHKIQIVEIS